MQELESPIPPYLLGANGFPRLRPIAGYDWLQHFAMAMIADDRQDEVASWYHIKSAAKAFMASVQIAGGMSRQWYHLSESAIKEQVAERMLPTFVSISVLYKKAIERFRIEVGSVCGQVLGDADVVPVNADVSLLSNIYLAISRMSHSKEGVYYVHNSWEEGVKGIQIHGRLAGGVGLDDHIARFVTEYSAAMVERHDNNQVSLTMDELEDLESILHGFAMKRPSSETASLLVQN
jgi:hypothetical protein